MPRKGRGESRTSRGGMLNTADRDARPGAPAWCDCARPIGRLRNVIAAALLVCGFCTPAAAGEWGSFTGKVVAQFLDDGREMKLVENFAYRDPWGYLWNAPAGSIINGASIPKIAWPLVGGPFEGKYRDASVIHDVACDRRSESWERTHEAFYTAMLASGVGGIKAKTMYAAVYFFGPRWQHSYQLSAVPSAEAASRIAAAKAGNIGRNRVDAQARNYRLLSDEGGPLASIPGFGEAREVVDIELTLVPLPPTLSEADFARLKEEIESKDLSLQEIRNYRP